MKAIKTLLAASALATVAGAANATVWDVQLSATDYFVAAGGNLVFTYNNGTYDDVAKVASFTGAQAYLVPYNMLLNFDQTINMNPATGKGKMNALTNCTDNAGGNGCSGFSPALQGPTYNTLGGFGATNTQFQTPVAFTPVDGGVYTWTLQFYAVQPIPGATDGSTTTVYVPVPLQVTLHSQTPAVPVPAAAWLFGSGLLGLAGTARRRRAA